jgi:hypothetical protein
VEADLQACKEQLYRISGALRQYQKLHAKLPKWFLDLHPDLITDMKAFVCPVVLRHGDLRSLKSGVAEDVFSDPLLANSYSYEFSAKKYQLAPGVRPTYLEYKTRQMALVGDVVPVVRCFAHDQILNLSIGGEIYPSGRYWEDNYTHIVPHEALSPQNVFRDLLAAFLKKPRTFPPRSSGASARMLDLTESCNFGLNETVSFGSAGGEDFLNLPKGTFKLDGVNPSFDIRGRIQVKGKRLRLPFPARVDGIKVKQQCRRVHFICGTVYNAAAGTEIGRFDVHYADGQSNRIQIIYGRDVQDWLFDPQQPQAKAGQVAWQGATSTTQASQHKGKHIRLYHLQWENPSPEARIASLDFVSALTDAAPFVIAITLE